MANSKATYYRAHLYAALTAGEWATDAALKVGHRGSLSWSELLRKFRKHCPHLHDLAEVASHTQSLSLLLIKSQQVTPDALDGDNTNPDETLTLGHEYSLAEEHREDAQSYYSALEKLPKSDSSELALASYSFALGRYNDALSQLASSCSQETSSLNHSNFSSVSSALSVPMTYESKTTTASRRGSMAPSISTMDSDIKDGNAWKIIEKIRVWCLQGMTYESLHQPSTTAALKSYENALPILDLINIPKSLNDESFTRYRELWRWVERLLWRASILSAKTRSSRQTLPLLRIYQSHSVHWPATFRANHRSTIAQLHLRALIETYPSSVKSAWLSEVRSIVNYYRLILTATTTFPRAGERNTKVEEFADLCIAVWEASGASSETTGWVIEVLWWATRFTFNSCKIYRHLTRTLYVSGDADLARRTLKLYAQVVIKARVTGGDVEDDEFWMETFIQGARMLCRMPGGIDEVREAGQLLRKVRKNLDSPKKALLAGLKRAEGVWHACMALREQEPTTRPKRLSDSLAALKESLSLDPAPSTHFHLALALSRPGSSRDLAAAIEHARAAVEGDSNEVRYWHLLGLLLATTENWAAAKGVLEAGAELGNKSAHDEPEGLLASFTKPTSHTNGYRILEATNGHAESQEDRLLAFDAVRLPPAAMIHRPLSDYPPPTVHERLEYDLQLRITQLALIEIVDGPENAGEKRVEVFAWVAERKGLGEERRPMSIEPLLEEDLDASAKRSPPQPSKDLPSPRLQGADVDTGVPINLIPPSPPEEPTKRDEEVTSINGNEKLDEEPLPEKNFADRSRGRKVQRLLKERVHKGQEHIHTISRKIGKGPLKRSRSAPSLSHAKTYQASSIHSRQRLSASFMRQGSPEPPPPPSPQPQPGVLASRSARERRLLSNLWLSSAATFRRMAKIDQAKAAIREAELADDENPDVWVQLGLYYSTLGHSEQAIQWFHKALFIAPDHVSASVHLAQQYLSPVSDPASSSSAPEPPSRDNIDLATGLLVDLTRGAGWDVPEAWFLLARACGFQGKRARERECLSFALELIEGRGVRDIRSAVGYCL